MAGKTVVFSVLLVALSHDTFVYNVQSKIVTAFPREENNKHTSEKFLGPEISEVWIRNRSVQNNVEKLRNGISFVGCYTTAFSRQNENGFEISPLTWEVCVQLCVQRDSLYAGVESGTSTCYCGNNLAQQSEKVSPQLCDEECYADKTKTCGGEDNLLSLYQLKNHTSFSFIATTDNGLAYFKNNQLSPNFVSLPKVSTINAAYHFAENAFYFYSNRQIYKSIYYPMLRQHILYAVALVELREDSSSLALDWIKKKLYWSLGNSSIVEANLDGSNRVRIVITSYPSYDLTVDPYDRKLFFINDGKVFLLDLHSYNITNTDLFKYNRFKFTTNLAVDVHKKVVYGIGYYDREDDGDKHLVSTDYEGVLFRVLLRGSKLTGAFSISALNDQVFWGEHTRRVNRRTLYSYKVPTQYVLTQPQKVSTLPQNVMAIVLYHEDAQTPGEAYFCKKLKCSHLCTYTLATSAKCGCPNLMMLGKDHKTCKDIPGVKKMTEIEESTDDKFNISIDTEKKTKSGSSKKKSMEENERHKSRRKGNKEKKPKKSKKKSKYSEPSLSYDLL